MRKERRGEEKKELKRDGEGGRFSVPHGTENLSPISHMRKLRLRDPSSLSNVTQPFWSSGSKVWAWKASHPGLLGLSRMFCFNKVRDVGTWHLLLISGRRNGQLEGTLSDFIRPPGCGSSPVKDERSLQAFLIMLKKGPSIFIFPREVFLCNGC